jgi:septum formation protein
LLAQIGVPHVVVSADVDESERAGEVPRDYVLRLAREKARTVWKKDTRLPVLAADTTVVLDGLIFGKPRDREDALDMLSMLSGRTHEVLTAVALADARGVELKLNVSTVQFRVLGAEECAAYWETGEPRDKAGAYAIQGLAAEFIERLEGSYSSVMGLPLFETAQLLRSAGLPCGCTMRG